MKQVYMIGIGLVALYIIAKKSGMKIPGLNGADTMLIKPGNQIYVNKGGPALPNDGIFSL